MRLVKRLVSVARVRKHIEPEGGGSGPVNPLAARLQADVSGLLRKLGEKRSVLQSLKEQVEGQYLASRMRARAAFRSPASRDSFLAEFGLVRLRRRRVDEMIKWIDELTTILEHTADEIWRSEILHEIAVVLSRASGERTEIKSVEEVWSKSTELMQERTGSFRKLVDEMLRSSTTPFPEATEMVQKFRDQLVSEARAELEREMNGSATK